MRVSRVGLTFLAVAVVLLLAGGTPQAFHSGGVAECTGCHSMHSPKAGGSFLLVGSDPSSTCLSCHMHAGDTGPSSYHIATADADMPAGVPRGAYRAIEMRPGPVYVKNEEVFIVKEPNHGDFADNS